MDENLVDGDSIMYSEHMDDIFLEECTLEVSTENNIYDENSVNTNLLPENNKLEKIKFIVLLVLKNGDKKEALEWCMKLGVILSKFSCPKCHDDMKLVLRKDRGDGYGWYCRKSGENEHHVNRSVRIGSMFSISRMSMIEILLIIHCWVYKVPLEWMKMELSICDKTLMEWVAFCRKMCVDICASDASMIGGEGKVIEIIGGPFKVEECASKRMFKGEWVFCGFEKGSNRCFFKLVKKGDNKRLYKVIKSCVLPGTTIFSDFFNFFNCLNDEEFVNLALSNLYTFDDPVRTGKINAMTNFRIAIKHRLPKVNADGCFRNTLAEYVWRRKNSKAYDKMRNFIQAINDIYPPSSEDD